MARRHNKTGQGCAPRTRTSRQPTADCKADRAGRRCRAEAPTCAPIVSDFLSLFLSPILPPLSLYHSLLLVLCGRCGFAINVAFNFCPLAGNCSSCCPCHASSFSCLAVNLLKRKCEHEFN